MQKGLRIQLTKSTNNKNFHFYFFFRQTLSCADSSKCELIKCDEKSSISKFENALAFTA